MGSQILIQNLQAGPLRWPRCRSCAHPVAELGSHARWPGLHWVGLPLKSQPATAIPFQWSRSSVTSSVTHPTAHQISRDRQQFHLEGPRAETETGQTPCAVLSQGHASLDRNLYIELTPRQEECTSVTHYADPLFS